MSYSGEKLDNQNCFPKNTIYEWILKDDDLKRMISEVFRSCKTLLGANSGYVALRNNEGTLSRPIYLDTGIEICADDPTLVMPIRGLREKVYSTGKAVCENNFTASRFKYLVPQGHISIENVLFAPLTIENHTIGVMGLGNKKGGFSDFDASVATAFGRLAAITLHYFNILQALRNSEQKFRILFNSASDVVTLNEISDEGRLLCFLEVNDTAVDKFGHTREELNAMSWTDLITFPEQASFDNIASQVLNRKKILREVTVLTKNGRQIPLELSCQLININGKNVMLTIARDISERQKTLQALAATNEKLRAVNSELDRMSRFKSDFLANMSHELKTPLTAILLLTDELLSGTIGGLQPVQEEYLRDIQLSADQLLWMINDLLELPKIESGRLSLDLTDVYIDSVLFKVVKRLLPLARRREVRVYCSFQARKTIIADPVKVEQVISNLLSNAIKFSPQRTTVIVSVTDCTDPEQGVMITVTDYGPGIAEDEKEKVFEPFYQINESLHNEFGGVGLGLALVRRIVDLHTGWIKVDSTPEQGTTFMVFFPSFPNFANELD